MKTGPPSHYVKHNAVTRVPRNFIYFDSEAKREPTRRGEVQTFRCAVAAQEARRHDGNGWTRREVGVFSSALDLWTWVDARTQVRARTVCVAHNLGYDLRITRALEHLPALGWTLGLIQLKRGSAWATFKRDSRTLVLVDSMSWLPIGLERLGEFVEIPKLPLPAWDDSDEAWVARCSRDVEILAAACRRLWDWIRNDDLGNWKPTGAGQAWAAYRHRFMSHKLLAHNDDEARDAERASAWTGRCECWVHGKPSGGPFAEWDASAAYAHIGATSSVPAKLIGQAQAPGPDRWRRLAERYCVLAEVDVVTDVPTLPARVGDRIAWPVGSFTTTVWEHELRLALDRGATVHVRRLWWYRRAPALREWSEWALSLLGGLGDARDPVVVLAAKQWTRTLVGRFGARWSSWEPYGRSDTSDLTLGTVIDKTDDTRWELLQVGHELRREGPTTDSADAVVAIMAWVMAECRVRLWRSMEAAGLGNVLYVDTDGLIVNAAGNERLREAALPGLRIKGTYATAELLGPRQIVLSGKLRASGVPKLSTRVADRTWEGDVWRELPTSIRMGTPAQVDITTRRVRLTGKDTRRDHLPGGTTAPRRVDA